MSEIRDARGQAINVGGQRWELITVGGIKDGDGPNILGVPAGLTVFHVQVMVQTETRDGYEGSRQLPTFFVVGGNIEDACNNTDAVIRSLGTGGRIDGSVGYRATGYSVTVSTADPSVKHESRSYRMSTL